MPVALPLIAAGVTAGSTIYASSQAKKANKKATAAQTAANDAALTENKRQFDLQRADYAPWREAGLGALTQLANVHGIKIPGTAGTDIGAPSATGFDAQSYLTANPDIAEYAKANGMDPATYAGQHYEITGRGEIAAGTRQPMATTAPDPAKTGVAADPRFKDFFESPDYKYRVEQGMRAITGNKAARGLLDAGTTGQGLINYGQKAASQEFGSWYDRLANLAGVGKSAIDSSTSAGANSVAAQTGIIQNQGENLASSIATNGGIQAGLINGLGNTVSGLIQNWQRPGVSGPAVSTYNPQTVIEAVRTPQFPNSHGLINPASLYGAVI